MQNTGKITGAAANRQLRVQQKYFPRRGCRSAVFPEIRLSGKWLQKLGFGCGSTIMVKQGKHKLVIEVLR